MNEQIKKEAKDIGEMGNFVTLVPDLYRGKVADDREEAGHLITGLDWTGAVADIKGAAQYLLDKGCKKVRVKATTGPNLDMVALQRRSLSGIHFTHTQEKIEIQNLLRSILEWRVLLKERISSLSVGLSGSVG